MTNIEEQFRQELSALLKKYNATLEVENHWTGYAECGEDLRMIVYTEGVYGNGETIVPYTVIDLGRYYV